MAININRQQPAGRISPEAARMHKPDYLMVLFMALLSMIGLIVLSSASAAHSVALNAASSADLNGDAFMQKQLFYLVVGVVGFTVTAAMPISFWQKHRERLIWISLGLCALLAVLGLLHINSLAVAAAGAYRWFNLGFATFQPAELLKFTLITFLAGFLAQRIATNKVNDVHQTLVPVGVILGISLFFIIVLQRDMGTGLSLVGIVASMLFIANMKLRYFGIGIAAMLVVLIGLIVSAPHRIDRITTFFSSSSTAASDSGSSYHITQAKIAIGSGGFFGKGLGNSTQVYGYLPEAVTDSMFAILGEMFGFVGLITILAIFLGLFLRLLKTIDHLNDPYLRLLVAGVFGWLATQTIVNIGAMVGVLPLTGVTLPFISFGGTSLLFVMAALGLAFHVSRYTTHRVSEENGSDENSDSRRGIGRTRYSRTRGYQRA